MKVMNYPGTSLHPLPTLIAHASPSHPVIHYPAHPPPFAVDAAAQRMLTRVLNIVL